MTENETCMMSMLYQHFGGGKQTIIIDSCLCHYCSSNAVSALESLETCMQGQT